MRKPIGPEGNSSTYELLPTWFLMVITTPVVIGLLWFGRDFLIPLAIATLLFTLNIALIDRVHAARIGGYSIPRWLAYTSITGFIFLAVIGIGYLVSSQAALFSEAAPRYAERIESLKVEFAALLGPKLVSAVERSIANANIGSWLAQFAGSAGGVIGNAGLVLLYLAFMLAERNAFVEKLPRLCTTPDQAKHLSKTLTAISLGVRQYMWINTLTSAMSGTLAFIVLKVLGVDFAATLAFIVFLVNFIPTIGSVLGVMCPALLALLQFDTITPALLVVVVYGGGDAIIGNVIQPKLQGKTLNLSTFMVLVALAFWGILWGGVGAFMAVPLTVVIMVICAQFPTLQPFARLLSSDGELPGNPEDHDVQK